MGSNPAKQANQIAQASLDESKRQYNEQRAREDEKKATAKANALNSRTSANMAYSNNFQLSTDYTMGREGNYSLLTASGTPSVIGTLLGSDQSTLG